MKHLYFVRHGLSAMNVSGLFSGRTDTPLTDDGIEQCHAAGRELKDAGIQVIVASPIKRAKHTAEIIADELGINPADIIYNDAFLERDFGPLEGTPYSPNSDLDNIDGVEHSNDLVERVATGLDFLRTLDADTVLVVSHGAVGRALQALIHEDKTFHTSDKMHNAIAVKLI